MFLLLRTLNLKPNHLERSHKCFQVFSQSHFYSLPNYSEPLLQQTPTSNRRLLWIDQTRTHRTTAALLHANEAGNDKMTFYLTDNYWLPVTTPRITVNKQSEALRALQDPDHGHKTPGRVSNKEAWRVTASLRPTPPLLLLSSNQMGLIATHWFLTQGWPPPCIPHSKHSSSQLWHTFATLLLRHVAKWLPKKKKLHAVWYFCWWQAFKNLKHVNKSFCGQTNGPYASN